MTTLDILVKAREIQARGWVYGLFGADAEGNNIDPLDPRAVFHCARGSVCAAADCNPYSETELRVTEVLAAALPRDFEPSPDAHNRVAWFSNSTDLPTVVALFDRAIERQRTLESLLPAAHPPAAADKLRTAEPVS